MSLKIINTSAKREYLLLQATKKVNIGEFALINSSYNDRYEPSDKINNFLHFSPRNIKKGEYVLVYTGTGTDTAYKMCDNTPVYIFYWNLKAFDWNNTGDNATLIKVSEIALKSAA